MKKRVLKKSVVYSLYGLSFSLLLGGIVLLNVANSNKSLNSKQEDYSLVSRGLFDTVETVVNSKEKLIKPYTDEDVKIVKNYYDYQADEETQKGSLIYYENTYLQSSGVSYGKEESFDVIAILDGTVKEVKEDTTLGNVVVIEHSNNIVSTYQSLTDIKVKQGDKVSQGDVIAKSGTSNISSDLNNHLYFELAVGGITVNPENYYNKSVDEL